ncbi:conserved hypothetical protein [Rhodospirillaceae bacterium LM-1]|nr:conserved hypothetical protein [Rhodospirillaceae bacterium LM-1]
MDFGLLIGPAVVAAVISGLVATIGFLITSGTSITLHKEKLKADIDLAERKFALDARLADRKKRQDLAEEVLSGFYEVRDVMMSIRSPGGYEGEGKTRKRDPLESENEAQRKDAYFAILERLEARHEVIAKLRSRKYRMAAWFGGDAIKPFQMLHEAIVNVTVSAQMLVRTAGDGSRQINPSSHQKWEAAIWWGAPDPDPVATKIDEAIVGIENICQPILQETESRSATEQDNRFLR